MAPLPAADQRHPWLKYQIEGYTEGISEVKDGVFWRGASGVCKSCLEETIYDSGTFSLDFLGPAPSYVLIRDTVRRLCHRMIAYSISGRGQSLEKVTGVDLFYLSSMDRRTTNVPHLLVYYLFRHVGGRKSEARLSGGHFIGRLAMHFGLVNDDGLRGLQVVTRELPLIDLHKLERLNICMRYGDTWAWVALGPERQRATAAGTHEVDEASPTAEEVVEEILAPAQAPPPPLPASQPQTMSYRIERVKEECMIYDLLDTSGKTYQPFDSTLIGSSWLSFQRRVRPRTGDVSTSAAPDTDAQPDP
nr:zinc finger, CCHC-type [Tanacetum cinerariifolium]